MNLSISKSSPPTLRPLSDRNEKTSSITTVEGVIGSSSSMEGNNAIPSGSISRVSRIHHRRQHHRKKESDNSIQLEETNTATSSTILDGHTSTLPERQKPHRLLAKERPLYWSYNRHNHHPPQWPFIITVHETVMTNNNICFSLQFSLYNQHSLPYCTSI